MNLLIVIGTNRYNITTGVYPFEGDNIYKLYENIGKGTFTIPEEVDKPLENLLRGMLRKDMDERLTLQQVKSHPWTISRPSQTSEEVPIPALRDDEWHTMTVLPYLMEHHYGVDNDPTYFTEHQLNGQHHTFIFILPSKKNYILTIYR